MSASALRSVAPASPADVWHAVLRPDVELSPAFCAELSARMRAARLTFGERIHCPFLRPFFLSEQDGRRVREVAEPLAELGERIVATALRAPALLARVALTPEEERLARIEPGYARASTASRLDAFLLPNSLQFAEYNAESPAGAGYSQGLSGVFAETPLMARFNDRFDARMYRPIERLLDALAASYREWGGTASPRIAIVDWRGVPTWSEFELLRDAFIALGVRTVVCDPRELTLEGDVLRAAGTPIDLEIGRAHV